MKRSVTFAIGIGIFMAASALGISDYRATTTETSKGAEGFGLLQVENLTEEQRALLQAKYRYWTSSNESAPQLPH